MPESTLLYVIYLMCYACNTFFLIVFFYVVTYIAIVTYQLRGVIFEQSQDNHNQSLRIQRQASNMRRLEAIRSHRRPMINPLFIRSDLTCTVCMSEFTEMEDIVVLECHESHIYHYDCIENWIARGHRECPICRKIIIFLEGQDHSLFVPEPVQKLNSFTTTLN